MSFEIGTTAGGYEFIDLLESSRTGVAYKVRNVVARRFEMLRILPRNAQDDQERMERFLREIKVHARLVHPNIVLFYNAAEIEKQLVMTTELVEGVTLAERLTLGPMALNDAISLIGQVLSALQYAHALGVVHRDVTPSNILITPDGAVKLTGFALAKGPADPNLTRVGVVQGDVSYISPEQVKGVAELDGRTDIYSAGIVLYELLTGKRPFGSKSQFELMAAHVTEAPKPPSLVSLAAPRELDLVILTALAKEPSHRFQTAEEFREALETAGKPAPAAVAEQTAPAPPVDDGPALAAPLFANLQSAAGWGGRELMLAGAFLAVGALAFALLTFQGS